MKTVLLKSLTLTNFRGETSRTTDFNSGVTTISGGNGCGKSRHFDAFLWLLFGKDVKDRKDYEVKTRVNGEELHHVDCEVAGILDVDGEIITLKRVLKEDWVKPRGSVDHVFKGNVTNCWYNEVPVSVTEYEKRVRDIIEPNVFKMITNPLFFVNLNWKLQREQLFLLAGTISDAEIASQNPDFKALLDKISGKPFSDYKAEIAAKKSRIKADLAQIDPRIDQTRKMMPVAEDFETIEAEIKSIDEKIAVIDQNISSVTADIRNQYDAERAKTTELNKMKSECQQLEFDAQAKAKKDAFDANASRRAIQDSFDIYQREYDACVYVIAQNNAEITGLEVKIAAKQKIQEDLRTEWYEVNAKEYQMQEYNGETICPTCHRELPEEMITQAREIFMQGQEQARKEFNEAKEKQLKSITEKGKQAGNDIERYNTEIKELREANEAMKIKCDGKVQGMLRSKETLQNTPEVAEVVVDMSTNQSWVNNQKRIAELEEEIKHIPQSPNITEYQNQKSALNTQREGLVARLSKREAIKNAESEISRLDEEGKKLANQLSLLEREELVMREFTKTRIDECTNRINQMFKYVTFRLFDYTIEGNPVETCVPMVDGVSYGSANTAGQMNAGLDIINRLCSYYGVCAPIFVDNAESVNEFIKTNSQMVFLKVTNESTLTIS